MDELNLVHAKLLFLIQEMFLAQRISFQEKIILKSNQEALTHT